MNEIFQVFFYTNTIFAIISLCLLTLCVFFTFLLWNSKDEEFHMPPLFFPLILGACILLIIVAVIQFDLENIREEVIWEEYQKTKVDTINFSEISEKTKEFWNINGSLKGKGEGGALFLFGFGGGYGSEKAEGLISGKNRYTDYYCFYAIDKDSTILKYEIKSKDCILKAKKDAHFMITKTTKIVSTYPTGKDCLYKDSKGKINRGKQLKKQVSIFKKRTIYIDEKYIGI